MGLSSNPCYRFDCFPFYVKDQTRTKGKLVSLHFITLLCLLLNCTINFFMCVYSLILKSKVLMLDSAVNCFLDQKSNRFQFIHLNESRDEKIYLTLNAYLIIAQIHYITLHYTRKGKQPYLTFQICNYLIINSFFNQQLWPTKLLAWDSFWILNKFFISSTV